VSRLTWLPVLDLYESFAGEDEVVVPAIFPIEVGALLARVGEPPTAIHAYVDAILALAVAVVTIGRGRAGKICDLAIAARLRAADAAYVWLAMEQSLPLCTLDKEMAERGSAFCEAIQP
jgi:predicted nucleic acid-binding protein